MRFEPVKTGAGGMELQQILLDPRVEVQPHRAHITNELSRGFLEGEVQAALLAAASRIREVGSQTGFPGSRRAREQNCAAAVEAFAAEHCIEAGNTGRNSFLAHRVIQSQRGKWQNAETVLVDQEWILIGAVSRSAVFHDSHAPSRDLVGNAVIEQDHTIGDVLFQAAAG